MLLFFGFYFNCIYLFYINIIIILLNNNIKEDKDA